jgi:hypothetical protein
VTNPTPRPLYHRETAPVRIVQEARWDPGPVWTGAKNLAPTGIRSPERPSCSESLLLLLLLLKFKNILYFGVRSICTSSTYIHSGRRAPKCLIFFPDNYCSDVIFDKYTFTFNTYSAKINVMTLYTRLTGGGGSKSTFHCSHSLTHTHTYS